VGKFVALVALVLSVVVGLALLVAVAAGSGATPSGSPTGPSGGPGSPGSPGSHSPGSGGDQPGPSIPATWLPLYQQASATCPGMSWSILAAVGTVETGSGRSSAPGVWSGANSAGAEGPMQFEPAISCKRLPEASGA
jgi:hypothetical protein